MLYRHSEVFRSLMVLADLSLVAFAWLAAYMLRFHAGIPAPAGIPPFEVYLLPLAVIVPLWFWLYRSNGLNDPRRTASLLAEVGLILRANALGVVCLIGIAFFWRNYSYSRGVLLIFPVVSATTAILLRAVVRLGLRGLRRRGFNLRSVLIAGTGRVAEETVDRIRAHPEAGLRIVGALADSASPFQKAVRGVPIVGEYRNLKEVVEEYRVNQVILAVDRVETAALEKLLADLDDETVSVKLVPDLLHVVTLNSSVDELDGLPIINLRESPLEGWAAVQKRAFDLLAATSALVVLSPLLLVIGTAIRLTAGRPIFYVQERKGLDGRLFRMAKFRTMERNAEQETGPIWAKAHDPRRTRLGSRLRRLSLDELPQLWNVIRGDMSLVGPRPERPMFVEEFRREIPGYMLRHKVKAGITGWAQIHGWRGNTSLRERIEHDIYYIQNWSLELDLR
ncbi:MAG: undecaprenyl-phosphate glucose phosphotransferase, partial [Myxococcota bacterium]